MNNSSNWFTNLCEQVLREQEEEKYLQKLANLFITGKTRNYNLVRSIVLDIHLAEERLVNSTIGLSCLLGTKNFKGESIKDTIEAIGNIEYFRKIAVVEKLSIFSNSAIKVMKRLNDLRNALKKRIEELGQSNRDISQIKEYSGDIAERKERLKQNIAKVNNRLNALINENERILVNEDLVFKELLDIW